jgi:hypothetical protein
VIIGKKPSKGVAEILMDDVKGVSLDDAMDWGLRPGLSSTSGLLNIQEFPGGPWDILDMYSRPVSGMPRAVERLDIINVMFRGRPNVSASFLVIDFEEDFAKNRKLSKMVRDSKVVWKDVNPLALLPFAYPLGKLLGEVQGL